MPGDSCCKMKIARQGCAQCAIVGLCASMELVMWEFEGLEFWGLSKFSTYIGLRIGEFSNSGGGMILRFRAHGLRMELGVSQHFKFFSEDQSFVMLRRGFLRLV